MSGNPAYPGQATKLEQIFTYHAPNSDQLQKFAAIRQKALEFAQVIVANTPNSADQTAAVQKVREAVMTANAAIALNGLV